MDEREAVLLIGHGAIGRHVFEALRGHPRARVVAALCRAGRAGGVRETLGPSVLAVERVAEVPDGLRLAIECAGHAALLEHGPPLLEAGIDLVGVSNGALADDGFARTLEAAAVSGGARCRLLSGAIGAIDALTAARSGGLETVTYRGRKPPAGWRGSPAEDVATLDALTRETLVFGGSAREAARRFPKNANVAATVALAGVGLDATAVELIADPGIDVNRHEIEATGRFGRFTFTVDGRALEGNPRSSALTAMSVVRAIEERYRALRIG